MIWAVVAGAVASGAVLLWLYRIFSEPKAAESARAGTIAEIQRDEAKRVLKSAVEAEAVRDDVRRKPAGELRNDAGNLYRD